MPRAEAYKVAIVSCGDADARQTATPGNNRFHKFLTALVAGFLPLRRRCAFSRKLTRRPAQARSVRCCAATASIHQP